MFCPQCGQQQVSDEVRFCPRCGFQLSAVLALLSTGGVAPSELTSDGESARHRGVRHGMLMFFVGLIVTAVLGVLFGDGEPNDFPTILAPLSAIILVLGGLLRMFYALIFEEGKRKQPQGANAYAPAYAPPPERLASQEAAALPPPQSIPARAYAPPPRPHTAEMRSPPPSVTDSTTKLLKETPGDAPR